MKMTKKTTKKTSDSLINLIRVLRMNGMSYNSIKDRLGNMVSLGTIHKYGKDVTQLPKKLQRNPFDVARDIKDKALKTMPTEDEIDRVVDKIDYEIQNHKDGERWTAPLESIGLEDLIKEMHEPTGYISPLNDVEWFNYYIAPSFFGPDGKISKTQKKFYEISSKYQKFMIKVFRGVGKTVWVDAFLIRNICENRNITAAIQSREKSVSVKRVTHIQRELMTNKRIIADYGYLPHEKKWGNVSMSWKQSELTIKRKINKVDPTLCALSWKDSKMLGGHFDLVVFDDPWSEKLERNSERNKEKWLSWYDGTYQGCLNPHGQEIIICTPKGVNDIYKELENRQMHYIYEQPAIIKYPSNYRYIEDKNGTVVDVRYVSDYKLSDTCNNRYDIKYFLMKKKGMKPLKWEQEYQINPMTPEGLVFKWNDLRFFDNKQAFYDLLSKDQKNEISNYIKVIGAMDLAMGLSERADYTALVIVALFDNKIYILDGWAIRGLSKIGKAALIKKAKSEIEELEVVYMEADFQQSEDVRELKSMVDEVPILPVLVRQEERVLNKQTKLSGKEARIISVLDVPIESHTIHINKNMSCFGEFANEYRAFPRGDHDDVLDAIAICVSKLKRKKALLFGFSGR